MQTTLSSVINILRSYLLIDADETTPIFKCFSSLFTQM